MKKDNLINKINYYIKNHSLITVFLPKVIKNASIYLGIMVIILNDWRIAQFSFSDLFVVVGIAVLFPIISKISPRWLIGYTSILLLVIANILIASNSLEYSLSTGVFYVLKISIYMLYYILLYNYIKIHEMRDDFMKALINVAVVVSLIGIYVTLVMLGKLYLPYEFLWTFTRQDIASYTFAGGYSNIIRTRSVFSEPQHLGLFLNIVLASSLLGNFYKQINKSYKLFIIALASILTFSFSTIPVLFLILLFYLLKQQKMSFLSQKNFFIIICLFFAILITLWQPINETIIQRGSMVVSGYDGSASSRIIESWSLINENNILFGSGVGGTLFGWNNYAFLLTDFGIIGLFIGISLTYVLLKRNLLLGLVFIIFCFQKGGYLSGFFMMMLMIIFIASQKHKNRVKIFDSNYLSNSSKKI